MALPKIKLSKPPPGLPIMVYDGDCNFCKKWIARWQEMTEDRVIYIPYQKIGNQFPELDESRYEQAIHFIDRQGEVVTGAEAVFKCLAEGSKQPIWLSLYMANKFFRRTTEIAYNFVASNRMLFSKLTQIFWGQNTSKPKYTISSWLFIRLIGIIYFIAFVSFGIQAYGLVGSHGIYPMSEFLQSIQHYSQSTPGALNKWIFAPTLFWFSSNDTAITALTLVGITASIALVAGIMPLLSSFICWLLYLSICSAVPVFLNYQWDALLIEVGFLIILLTPWVNRQRLSNLIEPSRLVRWLVWWLLFRLMFESGLVKLLSQQPEGNNAWLDLTALNFHYFTQPLSLPCMTISGLSVVTARNKPYSLVMRKFFNCA